MEELISNLTQALIIGSAICIIGAIIYCQAKEIERKKQKKINDNCFKNKQDK